MKQISIFILVSFFYISSVFADNVNFVAKGPAAVTSGEVFKISYVIDSRSATDLRVNFPESLEILYGPTVVKTAQTQSYNGVVKNEVSITFTYTLKADSAGTITIPEAQTSVNGTIVKSNPLTIQVAKSQPDNSNNQQGTNSKLFIKSYLSKGKVYDNESFLYTLKVYSRYSQLSIGSMQDPTFPGCISQRLDERSDASQTQEVVNGIVYIVYTIRRDLLYPQKTGEITIPSVTIDFVVPEMVNLPINQFGNYYNAVRNVNISKSSQAVKIQVLPLPTPKPADFSNAVGNFEMISSINKDSLDVNTPITFKIQIKGKGNLMALSSIKPKFPADFEVFDPKVSSKITNGVDGAQGSINYEYLAIPRYRGNFTIPAVSFSYFDLSTKSYKTLSSSQYNIKVLNGTVDSSMISNPDKPYVSSQEDIKVLGEDIRFINISPTSLSKNGSVFFNTTTYWLWIVISLFLALLIFFILSKQVKSKQDLVGRKNKKANQMALRRLKLAKEYMKKDDREHFYEEILRALLSYLSDKLSIPTSELTKENAEIILIDHSAKEEEVKEFMDIVHICEFARYSPSKSSEELDQIYKRSASVISKIDGQIKK